MATQMSSTANLYMQAIQRLAPISQKQMKKLLEKAAEGDKSARRRVVEDNLRLVFPIANRYLRPGLELFDLIEEGNLGLIRAAEKFNPKRKIQFSTYARHWIEEFVRRAAATQMQMIQLPYNVLYDLHKCLDRVKVLQLKLGRHPTLTELSKKLHLSVQRVKMLLSLSTFSGGISSLETPIDEDEKIFLEDTLSDNLENSPDSVISLIKFHDELDAVFEKHLSEKEKKIILLHFGLTNTGKKTLEEIGKKLKISRERVRQLEKRALIKLQVYAQQKGWM